MMFRAVGRLCVPIWLFLAGYSKPTKNSYEIVVLLVLLVVVDVVFKHPVFPINILASILVCRWFVHNIVKDKLGGKDLVVWVAVIVIYYIPGFYLFEYGSTALLFALWGYLYRKEPNAIKTKIIALFSFLSFITIEALLLDFSLIETYVMVFGVAFVTLFLYKFETRFYDELAGNFIIKIVMFSARNTLYIYFIHVSLFVIVSSYIYADKFKEFSWFP